MKYFKILFLLVLFNISCKKQTDKSTDIEKIECSINGELKEIEIIKYHKWDGLRPNKVKITFDFKSDSTIRLQIIDTTRKHERSSVNFSCWNIIFNDSIEEPLYVLRQDENPIEINKIKKEQHFYLDFDKMIGWSLKEMNDYIPKLKYVELFNKCDNTCISLDQNFSKTQIHFKLDTEYIQKSDSIEMNLSYKYADSIFFN